MKRRKLEELSLIDDFLFQSILTHGKDGEEFCRILLTTILEKPIQRVRILSQKTILGASISIQKDRKEMLAKS